MSARLLPDPGAMNSKSPRLLALLTTIALVLAALAASAPGASAAPKTKPGPALAELWLREASRPAPGEQTKLSPALRRALPRAGALLAGKIASAGGGASASAARGPVVERVSETIGQEQLGGGVVAEGRIRGRAYEDGSKQFEVELEISDRKGNSVLYSPDYSGFFAKEDEVGCPTAAGLVSTTMQEGMGGTAIVQKGGRVVSSKTVVQGWRVRARGRVGTDARLQSVDAEVALTSKEFKRGLQLEIAYTGTTTASREGTPKASGKPTASVGLRAAGLSRAEEREYELRMERDLAQGSAELTASVSRVATQARQRLLEAEPTWYALPNECAELVLEPGAGIALEPDETRRVTGVVLAARDGGQASGRIDVSAAGPGRLIPVTPGFAAGAPASFIAAGGQPNAAGLSVDATAVATSTAGRARATWSARATPVKLPRAFVGTIASSKSGNGLTRSFHGNATYTRTAVVRGPDGSLNAWYELTAATLGAAKEILGPPTGCRYEANGANGEIESGDLELRVLPGGEVVYALSYDLAVPSRFAPTDCPPDSPSVAFDGDISVFLNSRRPGPVGNQMRPVGSDFTIQENGVGDVTDLPGLTTTASWTLVPVPEP